jgi:hypothetical protein
MRTHTLARVEHPADIALAGQTTQRLSEVGGNRYLQHDVSRKPVVRGLEDTTDRGATIPKAEYPLTVKRTGDLRKDFRGRWTVGVSI